MPVQLTEKKVVCYHCGEVCDNKLIAIDDKYFCCQGCKFVFELLSDSQLDTYYKIEDRPGIKVSEKVYKQHFAYLDSNRIKEKLLAFADGSTEKVTLHIPQIHCSSCIWLLENLNRLHPGIFLSRVDFLKKKLTVSYETDKLTLRQLIELLTSVGYEPQISLDDYEVKPKKTSGTNLIVRLAVAGFCFANIMLFSFPEYLATDGVIGSDFQRFFGYLNILLSLPVFFYSASIYFSSAYHGLKQRIINMDVPISLGILILFGRSLYEVIVSVGPGYFDSLTGLIFFLLIGKYFQQRTYESLSFDKDYKSYFPISITRVTNGSEEIIPITELKQDDIILVRNNELIPADSLLLGDTALIDYSFVTGESEPVKKKNNDRIYAGGRQSGGMIRLQVLKNVSESYLTQLWNEQSFTRPKEYSVSNLSNTFSKYFTVSIISIALLAGIAWMFIEPSNAVFIATAVLIIACPCALALSTPFTLGTAQRILGRNKLYLKNSDSIETIADADHVVFDKTGTLTKARASKLEQIGDKLTDQEKQLIASLVRHSTHPLSIKIRDYLVIRDLSPVSEYEEQPGKGLRGLVENNKIKIGSADWIGIPSPSLLTENLETRVYVSINDTEKGYFKISNEYRDGLSSLAESLGQNHTISILSGDNENELNRLQQIFPQAESFRFNLSPVDKLNEIEHIQKAGKSVIMFGDGLNDAGALKQADVGIAVTENISSFSPASDGIMDASQLHAINKFISFSKISVRIILFSFGISLTYNIIGVSLAVAGLVSPLLAAVLMPLSSITVVLFTTIATRLSARKLGL